MERAYQSEDHGRIIVAKLAHDAQADVASAQCKNPLEDEKEEEGAIVGAHAGYAAGGDEKDSWRRSRAARLKGSRRRGRDRS